MAGESTDHCQKLDVYTEARVRAHAQRSWHGAEVVSQMSPAFLCLTLSFPQCSADAKGTRPPRGAGGAGAGGKEGSSGNLEPREWAELRDCGVCAHAPRACAMRLKEREAVCPT